MFRKTLYPLLIICASISASAQNVDSLIFKKIYTEALTKGMAYEWLRELTSDIGNRLSGSPEADRAVEWTKKKMLEAGADNIIMQEVMVPRWIRGNKEIAHVEANGKKIPLSICALGNSIATPKEGLTAQIIEVNDFSELKELGEEKIKGKIIFFNHPFKEEFVNPFDAYGEAILYRWAGATQAARYGAFATVTRS